MQGSDKHEEVLHRKPVPRPTSQPQARKLHTLPNAFIAITVLGAATFSWPLRWIVSGTPFLIYALLLGDAHGYRVLPVVPLWAIFSTINFVYMVASTSWLLYWVYSVVCYPCLTLACLFQFDAAANFARKFLRKTLLRDLHFIKDKVAFFDLPALEIDTDVNGLLVVRGVTFSLSTLTFVAHGVEAGIKLSEDIELAIQTDKVTVALFRRIDIDDVYANVKGGELEMTFGSVAPGATDPKDERFMVSDTAILKAASAGLDGSVEKMTAVMTGDRPPQDSENASAAFETVKQVSLNEEHAGKKYAETIRHISESSTLSKARASIKETFKEKDGEDSDGLDPDNEEHMRAAICTRIHDNPSIPHPPKRSIRVSTLSKNSYPRIKRYLHRFPLLYRLLLSPICYFHPVRINSITSASSGKWFASLMRQYLFKHWSGQDQEIRKIEQRISAWLEDAIFPVELGPMHCTAQFPVNTNYDIDCHFKVSDIMAYRILPDVSQLIQVVRLGGGDAKMTIPIYLFPHHEHIMPPIPTQYDEMKLEQEIIEVKGTPKEVRAKTALYQLLKDEANMRVSAHAHLPARFHQDLLNFTAALIKATKVIESDRGFEEARTLRALKRASTNISESDISSIKSAETADTDTNSDSGDIIDTQAITGAVNGDQKGFKALLRKVDSGFKEASSNVRQGMHKASVSTVSAMANDRWIAKLVGKITKKLEKAQGELGYTANVSVSMEKHRERWEDESKILP